MVVYVYVYMGGVGRGSGWLVRTVERVSVVQLDGLLGREQRVEGCNIFFGGDRQGFGMDPILPTSNH
jgi:hypothetical protein